MTYPQPPNSVDLGFEKPSTAVDAGAVNLSFGETLGRPPVNEPVYPQLPGSVELIFSKASTVVNPRAVDLVFGESSGPPIEDVYDTTVNAKFKLRGSVVINYDTSVWRGVSAELKAPHQQGLPTLIDTEALWQPSLTSATPLEASYDDAQVLDTSTDIAWNIGRATGQPRVVPWNEAKPLGGSYVSPWVLGNATAQNLMAPWQEADDMLRDFGLRFGLAKSTPTSPVLLWQTAGQMSVGFKAPMNQAGKPLAPLWVMPWQQGKNVTGYGGDRFLPPPPVQPPTRPPITQHLTFCGLYPDGGNTSPITLVFGFNPCGAVTPDAPLYILPAKVYMSVNLVEAYLHPSGERVPIFDLSLSADVDSTVWTFSASAPAEYFDALVPVSRVPQQIRFVVNGLEWVLLVENLKESIVFGQRRASIGGRSVTAMLGDPYALATDRLSTVANTAQQHALDALQFSGVALDWSIDDWLVPAGAWSHSGTPLEAVQALSQGVGGFLNSHRSIPEFIVRHPYPLLPGGILGGPWNWEGAAGNFAADVELAPDAIRSRSIERADGPDVDGVFVSGTVTGGIERHIVRAGTLGAKLATMTSNQLITAQAAAVQLGYSVLGLAGGKHKVALELPVRVGLDEPGVLEVGQLVQVNDPQPWRGRVRGVQVNFNAPTLVQTVTLERHLML